MHCSIGTFKKRAKCILMVIMSRPYIKNIVLHCLDFFILFIAMLSIIVDYMVPYGCYDVLSKQLLYIYNISYFDNPLYLVAFFVFVFLLTPAIGLLIYYVTDMGAYKLIIFLLHYICVCIFIEILK